MQAGRPRQIVDYATILHLRDGCNLGWRRVAREYHKRTGQLVSRETLQRRYREAKTES